MHGIVMCLLTITYKQVPVGVDHGCRTGKIAC